MTLTGQHRPEVAARVSKSLKKQRARQQRLREYEADPETLHQDEDRKSVV